MKFLDIIPREVEFEGKSLLCNMYGLSADQAINSSLLGKDVVNYEYVTEYTLGKGRKVYQFVAEGNELDLSNVGNGFNPFRFTNKNLINEKFYADNETSPVKETIYNYTLAYAKNALSSNSYGNPLMIAPYGKIIMIDRNVSTASGGFYSTQVLESYPIESGKFLLDEVVTKDYINGSTVTTKVNSEYSIDNIQKPINLMKQKITTSDPTPIVNDISYSYAHEKGNQLMIDKNMIGIPLETTSTQTIGTTTNTLAKTETVYPKTTAEITNNSASLVLPLSIKSYDIPNNTFSTAVTYNKYDNKGNLLQYTPKEIGSPVAIVWVI